jgi:hypothetical protein
VPRRFVAPSTVDRVCMYMYIYYIQDCNKMHTTEYIHIFIRKGRHFQKTKTKIRSENRDGPTCERLEGGSQ